jgi:molecular chaperone DnaK
MTSTINYGIDLGTTNSSIAKYDGSEIRVFKNRDQNELTPSVVRIDKTGRIIVGKRAYQTLFLDPENVSSEFKRLMGQSDKIVFSAAARSLSPEELSAEVLKSLLADARLQTNEKNESAVITVPAAFGQLQCEATARAATLAGLQDVPLLQEPLAASIAYGMKTETRDKKWLVYDLGGGTFDIAVISTKGGHMSILAHQGNNMLGGKDFDRLIVKTIIWPHLERQFQMPTQRENPAFYRKLSQILRVKAEEAKIELSFSDTVNVSIFDIGNDLKDTPIEAEISFSRQDLHHLVEPYILKTIDLCKTALKNANLTTNDIETILLVGGPTYMPIVRELLKSHLGIRLDFSIDPMTVVARGAAIYASTIPLTKSAVKPDTENHSDSEAVLNLAYETVWSETSPLVAGKIERKPAGIQTIEVSIQSESGHWNSGWIPVKNGYFEINVHLLENKTNKFWIYLRDEKGNDITPNPDSITIRHGLTLSEPPLPHTIGAEIVNNDGKKEIDVVFGRSTPLPAFKNVIYKARKTLVPGQNDDYLAIKIWEGENLTDPEANNIVGALKIRSEEIRRPIAEGSEIEISIEISASRLLKVQAFVPLINQHFQERVYIPKENEDLVVEKVKGIDKEIDEHFKRIVSLNELVQEENEDSDIKKELSDIRVKLEELAKEKENYEVKNAADPDNAKRVVQKSKEIRGNISRIENEVVVKRKFTIILRELKESRETTQTVVENWGTTIDKKEFELLNRDADKKIPEENERALIKVIGDLNNLKWRILFEQDWYIRQCFEDLCKNGDNFVNKKESQRLIALGQSAIAHGDSNTLKEVNRNLWELLPKSTVQSEQEKKFESGIKRK